MGKFIDLTGKIFNRLLVIRRAENKGPNVSWLCICQCFNEIEILGCHLKSNHTKSCGCLFNEIKTTFNKTHGKSNSKTHQCWKAMKRRCFNINEPNYNYYGGRGITVCNEWRDSFENFLKDMGECPKGMSLDRIDVNGNYCKSNCRWVTANTQAYNQRRKSSNTSGRTGVYWHKRGYWSACIGVKGKLIHLGDFKSFEEAKLARENAEIIYYQVNKE